jgi:type II secretory pathway component PulC
MRVLLWLALAAGCGPHVDPKQPAFDEDLGGPSTTTAPELANAAPEAAPRSEAPPGKGLRTGTIARAKLVAVLDGGPGAFLRQLEVAPHMDGDRFIGWQLVQLLDRGGPLVDVDLAPGDVLLAINGKPLARPDQLQAVWDSLRTANAVDAELWRGTTKVSLAFAIDPPVARP